MSVTVYGVPDDLIEIEGDIREEFNSVLTDTDEGALLVFSDGTILRIRYTEQGVWRIVPVISPGGLKIDPAPEHDDDNYSDRATIYADVWWVVMVFQPGIYEWTCLGCGRVTTFTVPAIIH